MPDMTGKVCIVTGAAGGMGLAHARLLVASGATVILTDVDEERGAAAAAGIGAAASFVKQDVSSEPEWQALIDAVVAKHGKLDVLVNNAGIMVPGTIEEIDLAAFQRGMNINTASVLLGCKYAIPAMAAGGGGAIVNLASVSALWGEPDRIIYAATKAAVHSITKTVAVYCKAQGNGVRCNCVHPDGVITPMTISVAESQGLPADQAEEVLNSIQRMCQPEEVARVVVFLASDDASFINGAGVPVDNGVTVTQPAIM